MLKRAEVLDLVVKVVDRVTLQGGDARPDQVH
jgi:hypothetical protein